ncbi:transporter substrate-binding domain-containing protein [Arthrospira platensis]|jgi:ABC-type amino acid transport substrate-binding protein|uniref:Transporter n=1 Tax=Limnospira platensis NIES-46 TaxID=1236695 RepID=A0A5M3T869_LIMPL|nr:transporter substrate-binding domain-containing protein [Arthrospira platensis]AMW28798.1 peptidoglycan-binding protein [Arthrospira platensis YZ]MBD2668292.1 transporter substrate-binding domain-containing protein [Arthrospira platensis FACHB-439]MBD2709487.1 transporter substrate-binding domain-containing protein [Arthrospira platensis FACHB-835]MDF2210333.1 transporter substrate-binding domain-containing protein [Arthrospira platensis NCB002]MDT9181792.1 transporter substrate-binding dom
MKILSNWKYNVLILLAICLGSVLIFTPLVKTQDAPIFLSSESLGNRAQLRIAETVPDSNNGDLGVTEAWGDYDIIELQNRLQQKGYYLGAIDGIYGEQTREAISNFQLDIGLESTGIVNQETWEYLLGNAAVIAQKNQSSSSMSPDMQKIIDRGELIVAINQEDSPPFFAENVDGELIGLDVEIGRKIAKSLGVQVRFDRSAKTFNEVVNRVYKGDADMAISKLSQTLERAKIISFSHPYLTMRHGLLLNRLQLTQATRNKDLVDFLRDFQGKIGVINASSYEIFARAKFPKATIIRYSNWEDLIRGAMRGDILAAYRDELEVKKILINYPNVALNFQTVALTDTQDPIAIALPWSSNHLLQFVNLYLTMNDKKYTVSQLLEDYSDLLVSPSNSRQLTSQN